MSIVTLREIAAATVRALCALEICWLPWLVCVAGLPALAQQPNVDGPALSIKGRDFYKDGSLWQPKGLKVEAFGRPLGNYEAATLQAAIKQGRSLWGTEELRAIKTVFRADTIRFAVSQPGLDQQSSIFSPQYLSDILAAIRLARASGFVVIASMDAQAENGIANLPCMPNDSTVRAWRTLAPELARDQSIMLELADEPCQSNNPQGRRAWAQSMQAVIDAVRASGARNILLLDGLWYARSTNGLFPLVHDSLKDRLALAVHPYLATDVFVTEQQWHNQFGASAVQYPMIATEWNATPTNGCAGSTTPALALSLMRYLQSLHVGLIGWAIDSNYGRLVKDHRTYAPTDYTSFKGCSKIPSESGGGQLLANYPND
jgi:hypothetical protein